MMSTQQVLEVLDEIERRELTAWIDGGWGVDALLGEQTRDHDDLDVVIVRCGVEQVIAWLRGEGFAVERDWLPVALALRHPDGRAVDLHPIDPTDDGGGVQQDFDGRSYRYAAPVAGRISGRSVRCCSVEDQVATHLGYEPDENDRADMARLEERFGVSWPG